MSAITSALVCTVKFVNLFARCQHLSDIAATLVDVIRIFCCKYPAAIMPCRCYNFAQNVII